MARPNVFDGEFQMEREEMGVRGVYPESDSIGVATRHPFVPVPEGGDEGVLGLFRAADNQRGR